MLLLKFVYKNKIRQELILSIIESKIFLSNCGQRCEVKQGNGFAKNDIR